MAEWLKKFGNWATSGGSLSEGKKAEKEQQKLIDNRPTYTIDSGYVANKNMAANQAYGRNAAILNAESNIDQSTANAIAAARDASGTSGSLMQAIATAGLNQNNAYTNLATQEAALKTDAMSGLQNAIVALAEERDKAWNYNENQPYQQRLAANAAKIKKYEERTKTAMQTIGSIIGIGAGNGGGNGNGGN